MLPFTLASTLMTPLTTVPPFSVDNVCPPPTRGCGDPQTYTNYAFDWHRLLGLGYSDCATGIQAPLITNLEVDASFQAVPWKGLQSFFKV